MFHQEGLQIGSLDPIVSTLMLAVTDLTQTIYLPRHPNKASDYRLGSRLRELTQV